MNGFESIVNRNADVRWLDRAQAIARKRERRLNAMLYRIWALALISICMIILCSIGAIHSMLAWVISVASAMAACFALGLALFSFQQSVAIPFYIFLVVSYLAGENACEAFGDCVKCSVEDGVSPELCFYSG